MKYSVGDRIIAKKPHACGGNEWAVERVGADVKLKCVKCGKTFFLMEDQVQKMTKKHVGGSVNEQS